MMNVGRRLLAAAAVAALLALAACGGDDDSSSGDGGGGSSSGPENPALAELAKGTYAPPPSSAPKPEAGKKVWIISCGQSLQACALPTGWAKEAGEKLGWEMTVFDGAFDVNKFGAGIRQAVAADADGILLNGVDCPFVTGALKQAKAAGVEVVPFLALDCNDPAVNQGPAMFSSEVQYLEQYEHLSEFLQAWGAARAQYAIAKTDGKAKALDISIPELISSEEIRKGAEAELAKCSGCELVETIKSSIGDYNTKLQQKIEQALVRHPDVDTLWVGYNTDIDGGAAAAIRQSGKTGQIIVIGGEGQGTDWELVDQGLETSFIYWNQEWLSWASIDQLNRVFNGEPDPVPQGTGWALVDKEHNWPSELPPVDSPPNIPADIDWKAAYEKAWGIAG